jgi:hypothetical protein
MISLNDWDSDYFNRYFCADILHNYIDLEREKDILNIQYNCYKLTT